MPAKAKTPEEANARFWAKVNKTPDCWLWTGATAHRYGCIRRENITYGAHRLSYEMVHGAIPKGMCVLHRCDTPLCVNPDHLFLGTQTENMNDKHRKGRHLRGDASPNAKLTANDVREIRYLKRSGMTQSEIGRRFGVDQGHISAIVNRKKWVHLE